MGLDGDPAVLERARRKAADVGVEVRFDEGFSDDLPYENGSLDAVLSTLFFHHLIPEVKQRTARELARVLKPGGRLDVADWGAPSDPLMRLLSLGIRALDGAEATRDNLAGRLPEILEAGGLRDAREHDRLRTIFGSLAFYSARR